MYNNPVFFVPSWLRDLQALKIGSKLK